MFATLAYALSVQICRIHTMTEKELTNFPYISLSATPPDITSNPGDLFFGIEGGVTGRNLSRNSLTGIGPTKHFLISESILLRSSASGVMVAANLEAAFCVFFAGVQGEKVGFVPMIENGPTTRARARAHTFCGRAFLLYRVDNRVGGLTMNGDRAQITVILIHGVVSGTIQQFLIVSGE